jgi:serine protease Do
LALQNRLVEVFAHNEPSIVRIKATVEVKSKDGNSSRRTLRVGTGFFVSQDGHVLTSDLVQNARLVWIEHRQIYYLSEVIGHDPISNIALLKVKTKPKEFSFLRVDDVPILPRPGTFVMTLSAAMEFLPSPGIGIVQGHETNFANRMFPTRMLRTSVSVGPGEIGAPMLDLDGRFIGMIFASLPDLRSSCVLPASAVLRVRDDLLLTGKASYAWFGLTVTSQISVEESKRVVVDKIVDGSPSSSSGIRKGDQLLKIGDHIVRHRGDVANAAFFTRPGQFVTFLVKRGSKELEISVRVSGRPLKNGIVSSLVEVEQIVPDDGNVTEPPTPIPSELDK